ncbi:MAG: SRPBCC family protein [Solirubrobacteraceae bacterium]
MPSAYIYIYETDTSASAQSIWSLYEDVSTWPRWDAGAEEVTREGEFVQGSSGTMKFIGQDPLPYRLTKVEPFREFIDETLAGPVTVRVSHKLTPLTAERLRITYRAEIYGPTEQAQQIGPAITADFPDTVASLIALATEHP